MRLTARDQRAALMCVIRHKSSQHEYLTPPQRRAVRSVAGEALTFSESDLQIHEPNCYIVPAYYSRESILDDPKVFKEIWF